MKLVDHSAIKEYNWDRKTSQRVAVAPKKEDEDFDFKIVSRLIHIDTKRLNEEAIVPGKRIAQKFEGLRA